MEMGWEQLKNGELPAQAASLLDVVITVDRNLKHQQNLAHLPVSVIVLAAASNKRADLLALVPRLEAALSNLESRSLIEIGP